MHPRRRSSATSRTVVAVLAILALVSGAARVRAAVLYDASLGTMPEAQGWTLHEDISPAAPYLAEVTGGELHLDTGSFATTGATGGGVWWSRDEVALDFTAPFSVEIELQVDFAPDHSVNATTGWPRPGFALAVYDVQGRMFWVGFGGTEIFLASTAYGQYSSANTVTVPFLTTDARHVYRVEPTGTGGLQLRIDGTVSLTLASLGSSEAAGPTLYFGDVTYWANSGTRTARVSVTSGTTGAGPGERAGVLWAAPLGTPAGAAGLAYRVPGPGSLVVDILDVAGRRVAGERREVAGADAGTVRLGSGSPSGLYFYRARFTAAHGAESQVSGRLVLAR